MRFVSPGVPHRPPARVHYKTESARALAANQKTYAGPLDAAGVNFSETPFMQ